MLNKYFKLSINIGILFLCTSCGVHREEFSDCIKPTTIAPIEDSSFVLQKPLGLWHGLKVSLNEKWSDTMLCIEESFVSDLSCKPFPQDNFEIKRLNVGKQLLLDGNVRLETPWGVLAYFTYKQTVYLRGYEQGNYFWLSTDYLRLLTGNKNDEQAVALVNYNKEAIDYLTQDRKLELTSTPNSWPCDPDLVQDTGRK